RRRGFLLRSRVSKLVHSPHPYDTGTTIMGIGIGMRGIDLQKFLMVARERKVILLVRHTNEDSLRYVGMHYLAAENKMPAMGDPQRPESWAAWGVGRAAACSAEWRWRVDVDPAS